MIADGSFCLEQAREDKAKKEPTSISHGLLKLNSNLKHIMNNKIFQALSILMLATGIGTAALANEAKANSEDVLRITADNGKEQIQNVIEPKACYYIPGIGWVGNCS